MKTNKNQRTPYFMTKLFIILTTALILTFTAACKESGTDSSGGSTTTPVDPTKYTYNLSSVSNVTNDIYTEVFDATVPTSGNAQVLTGSKIVLNAKCIAAGGLGAINDSTSVTGGSYDEIGIKLQEIVDDGNITASQKTEILDALKTSDASGFGIVWGGYFRVYVISRS